jgi:hypothetical protein
MVLEHADGNVIGVEVKAADSRWPPCGHSTARRPDLPLLSVTKTRPLAQAIGEYCTSE